jgi:hypothetical protein
MRHIEFQFPSRRKITILIIKAKEMHYFLNLFDKVLYMFRTCPGLFCHSSSVGVLEDANRTRITANMAGISWLTCVHPRKCGIVSWLDSRSVPRPFLWDSSITLTYTTLDRTLLDEWSAWRRDLYLTTHSTHNRQTSVTPVRLEAAIPASERPQIHALDRAATGNGNVQIVAKIRPFPFSSTFLPIYYLLIILRH